MKTFVSYSWDGDRHKDWVRQFTDDLRRNAIDATLDQYDLALGDDRFAFMESSIRQADCILCVCTPNYVERANQRQRGVGVETSLLTPQLLETHPEKQYIPVIGERANGSPPTPDYVATLVFADFTDNDRYADQLEALLRHLHQKP